KHGFGFRCRGHGSLRRWLLRFVLSTATARRRERTDEQRTHAPPATVRAHAPPGGASVPRHPASKPHAGDHTRSLCKTTIGSPEPNDPVPPNTTRPARLGHAPRRHSKEPAREASGRRPRHARPRTTLTREEP